MARYCESCGAEIGAGSFFCQSCGAPVPQSGAAAEAAQAPYERRRVTTPRTIAELEAFCDRHELPLAKMRFFIGLDYPGAKAFGIYRDGDGNFVVYKNKADGSRAVRYRGPDEAYAVKEIFDKLKEEATNQRRRVAAARTPGYAGSEAQGRNPYNSTEQFSTQRTQPRTKKKRHVILGVIIAVAAAVTIVRTSFAFRPHHHRPATGYYNYGGNYYYSQNSNWYLYDDDGWYPISVADELLDNAEDYYASYSYSDDYGVSDFADSDYYTSYSDYSSSSYDDSGSWDDDDDWDWDDDDDWDSGSDWDWDTDWDSGSTDWDSDW